MTKSANSANSTKKMGGTATSIICSRGPLVSSLSDIDVPPHLCGQIDDIAVDSHGNMACRVDGYLYSEHRLTHYIYYLGVLIDVVPRSSLTVYSKTMIFDYRDRLLVIDRDQDQGTSTTHHYVTHYDISSLQVHATPSASTDALLQLPSPTVTVPTVTVPKRVYEFARTSFHNSTYTEVHDDTGIYMFNNHLEFVDCISYDDLLVVSNEITPTTVDHDVNNDGDNTTLSAIKDNTDVKCDVISSTRAQRHSLPHLYSLSSSYDSIGGVKDIEIVNVMIEHTNLYIFYTTAISRHKNLFAINVDRHQDYRLISHCKLPWLGVLNSSITVEGLLLYMALHCSERGFSQIYDLSNGRMLKHHEMTSAVEPLLHMHHFDAYCFANGNLYSSMYETDYVNCLAINSFRAAKLFCLTCLVSETVLQCKGSDDGGTNNNDIVDDRDKDLSTRLSEHDIHNIHRFFNIAAKLPVDIKMILCNRCYGSAAISIKKSKWLHCVNILL